MALTLRALSRNYGFIHNITKPVKCSVANYSSVRILTSGICYRRNINGPLIEVNQISILPCSYRQCSTHNCPKPPQDSEPKKQGLMLRLKEMYRDYWYVVLPVHLFTSAIWFGSFYYAVRSGVDVLAILKSIGVSDAILAPVRDSAAGYFALAFALYKLATPLRYAVTVGGTTYAIKKLTGIGWIKPVPSRERLKEMIQEKKDTLQDRFNESKSHYQDKMKERRSHLMDEMKRYKTDMRNMKNKVKKM